MEGSPEDGPSGGAPVDEEELRRQLEEELRRVRIEDLVAQSIASILNLSARRIVKEDERDLEQARLGIDSARALAGVLPPDLQEAIRPALSELQMLYARHAGEGGDAPSDGGSADEQTAEQPRPQQPPGPAGGGLWTPGRG